MKWFLTGLLFHLGDPITVKAGPFDTHGNCVAALRAVMVVALKHKSTGGMLDCKEEVWHSY